MLKSHLLTHHGCERAVLLLLLLFSAGRAAECRLELTIPLERQAVTLFLDFNSSGIKPRSETFKLCDEAGKELSFSFDFCYGLPPPGKNEYRREPDGFYSKEMRLFEERHYIRPGWLSFTPHPGKSRYSLSFEDGAEIVTERSDPAIRPWWIELLADPYFRQPLKPPLYSPTHPDALQPLVDSGVEFAAKQTLFLNQGLFLADERVLGRRLISYCLLQGEPGAKGQYSLPFPSAIRPNAPVMHVYYQLPDDRAYAIYCEGLVESNAESIWLPKHNRRFLFNIDRPGKLLALHLQSPPSDSGLTLKYFGPQLLEPGDDMRFQVGGLQRDILQTTSFRLADGRSIRGAWIENWQESPPFLYSFRLRN